MVVAFKKRLSSPTKRPDVSRAHLLFYFIGTVSLPVGERSKIGRGMMLTTYVHLVSMLSAAIPLNLYIPSWHAKVKINLEQTTKAQRVRTDIVLLFHVGFR